MKAIVQILSNNKLSAVRNTQNLLVKPENPPDTNTEFLNGKVNSLESEGDILKKSKRKILFI